MSDTPDSSQPLENSGAAAIEAGERPAIAGNASDEVKEVLSSVHTYFMFPFTPGVFGDAIAKRVVTTEVTVRAHEDSEGKRYEGRVVVETTVEPDMVNGAWSLHGGCAAFLVDMHVASVTAPGLCI
ncbi:hypothetical protein AX16_004489 [Volvariella volvacea WC 439]|nr:hypothetical protein AX16_004489 [Volvariella volvacea WC 439]